MSASEPIAAPEARTIETRLGQDQSGSVSTRARWKMLFIIDSPQYGGAERHLLDLIHKIQEIRGPSAEISILAFGPDVFTERLEQNQGLPVKVVCLKKPESFEGWFKIFRQLKPSVVVFCYGWIWSFPWFAVVAAWLAGARRRVGIQHLFAPPLDIDQGTSFKSVLRRHIGGKARRIAGVQLAAWLTQKTICVSNAVRNSLLAGYRFPANRTVTIYNGVSISKFTPGSGLSQIRLKLGVAPDEFLLICAARLSEVKRFDLLLEALSRVQCAGVPFKCVIVGDGPMRDELIAQASTLRLTERVFFEGFRPDVRSYLQAGSAFVLASRIEGFPLSILEAMASGLPCIVTDVGGNSEAVIDGFNGLVVPSGSAEAIAQAIIRLATHRDELERMAQVARVRASDIFDIEDRMTELTNAVLGV